MKTSELKTEFIKELLACKGTERGLGAFRILRDAAPDLAAEVIALRGLLEQAVNESLGMSQAAKCEPLPFVHAARAALTDNNKEEKS